MRIVLVNPIASTPDLTIQNLFRPTASKLPSDLHALSQMNIVELASAFSSMGHETTVILGGRFPDGGEAVVGERLRVVGVETSMAFPFHPGLIPMTPTLSELPALREADIIQAGEFHQPSTLFASWAARDRGTPLVVWQETFRPMAFPGSLYQRAFEMVAGRAIRTATKRFVPRTTNASAYLRRLNVREDRIAPWIPTGLDLRTFAPGESRLSPDDFRWPSGSRILLVAARLHSGKGVDRAFHVMKRLSRTNPNVRLLVAGSGPEQESLQRLLSELGLLGLVRMLGRRSREEMVDLYRLAEVVLCTSRAELLPFVLMEGGACGRPSVTFDVGAVRDVVVDGQTGWVVRQGDMERFGAKVDSLLREDGTREALGAEARRRMETYFDIQVIATRLLQVYRAA